MKGLEKITLALGQIILAYGREDLDPVLHAHVKIMQWVRTPSS